MRQHHGRTPRSRTRARRRRTALRPRTAGAHPREGAPVAHPGGAGGHRRRADHRRNLSGAPGVVGGMTTHTTTSARPSVDAGYGSVSPRTLSLVLLAVAVLAVLAGWALSTQIA